MKVILAGVLLSTGLLAQRPPGLDSKALDTSVSPCTNFYQYSCGTWLKNNPIPADQSSWGRFSELN